MPELDKSLLFEDSELPSNERIVVRIEISSDEGSAVVTMQAKLFDVFSSERREVLDPEMCILEIGDDFYWQIHLCQDIVLAHYSGFIFSFLLLFLLFLAFLTSLLCFLLFALPLLLWLLFLLLFFFLRLLLLIALWHNRWRRKLRRKSKCGEFIMQLFSCSRNGHA